jgi:arsenite/tail-anchored protein-transporting ATPase
LKPAQAAIVDSGARHLFFTGKGGVGKTSVACATAIALADAGRRVLLVSTDPASNLSDVLGSPVAEGPSAVAAVPGLAAYDLDPVAAAADYRESVVGPYRGLLPEASVASIEEQLSGACTVEIAAFDEFSRLLGDPEVTSTYDRVVFDTAPTGHTLRLLTLPAAWTGFLDENTSGTSCLGPLAGLQEQRALYEATLAELTDPARTLTVLVTRPETSAVTEAARTSQELRELGLCNQHLVVNGIFTAFGGDDPVAAALEERGRRVLGALPPEMAPLPRTDLRLVEYALLGPDALRGLWQDGVTGHENRSDLVSRPALSGAVRPLSPQPLRIAADVGMAALVGDLSAADQGVIMTMGKGGVGKTTIAAALATALAERGHAVRLSSTDPATDLERALGGVHAGFTVSRIDPKVEVARYREEVMSAAGAGLDEDGRRLLEEDLLSPCTEEIAVFQAFAREIAQGVEGFVVLDTAPTGHTILLLDAALAYHRELGRQSGQVAPEVEKLLSRLRDQGFTKVVLVTLPETTPVNEAQQLADDLERAGIHPFAWVVNQSLLPLEIADPLLSARRLLEEPSIRRVKELATRNAIVPWQIEPPRGKGALLRMLGMDGEGDYTAKGA